MGEENKDIIPSWINIELIQNVICNFGQGHLQVAGFTTDLASAPGENYLSVLYRVVVKLSDGNVRPFLIKTMPAGGEMTAWAKDIGCFCREVTMLVEIMPKIQALLDAAAPGQWSPLAARCPLNGENPDLYIVMEDLRPQGFDVAERKRGLGLRHCLIAIRTLARFHAAGHLLIKRDPELIRQIDNFYAKEQKKMSNVYVGGMAAAAQVCKTWPGYEECSRRLEKFKNIFMNTITELNEPKPEAFNVILHGDFWINNMMFRYDEEGNPSEIKMVDFQLSRVASPTIDVLYFLTTSLSEDVSTHHQDLLIREYYIALKEAMSLLGMQTPSFQTFLKDMDIHGKYALFGTITVNPFVRATFVPDLEAAMAGDETALEVLYDSPEVKKNLQRWLPELLRKGWLPA